jgi:hypothetical protein
MKIAFALLVSLVAALGAASPTIKPGQYEVVSQFAMPGGRETGAPPRKDLKCYTEKDVQTIERILAQRDTAQGQCHVVSSKVTGSTLTFTTECASPDGRGGMTMNGKVDFLSTESYHAVVDMKMTGERAGSGFGGSTITINAKRIGDCTK